MKTGYGLTTAAELAELGIILDLHREGPMDLAATFLGAHAIPPEYTGNTGAYVELIIREMLPTVKTWWKEHAGQAPLPFVDVFCEAGVFDLDQTRAILTAARSLGFPPQAPRGRI